VRTTQPNPTDVPASPTATTTAPPAAGALLVPPDGGTRSAWEFAPVPQHRRRAVESFIRRGFEKAYRARITGYLPVLMALYREEELVAACGLNRAAANRLFLEVYLDAPVEQVLEEMSGTRMARESIVEVGNLTVARAGYARQLIVHLTAHLRAQGVADWVVFSAVRQLRNNFVRLGIPLIPLAAADRTRLAPAARDVWGPYYDAAPQVTAVRVGAAYHALFARPCTR
jgi:hypothetical protein